MLRNSLRAIALMFVVAGTAALGGCDQTTSVLSGGASVTKPIENPVQLVDIQRVKTVYAATLELVVKYREFCWSRPYAALMADPVAAPVCRNRREVVRRAQDGDKKAFAAIAAAEKFVRENPTISASSLVGAAWNAVQTFRATLPSVP